MALAFSFDCDLVDLGLGNNVELARDIDAEIRLVEILPKTCEKVAKSTHKSALYQFECH